MNPHSSLAEKVAALSGSDREAILADLSDAELAALEWDWRFWGRPNQIAPDGQWSTWLALAGRGWGKTEAGAQWIRERVQGGARSIALVAETQKDLEEVMVPRILSVHPEKMRPSVRYKPVRLTWPNGAIALGYNGTEPDQLRGPEFDTAWVDELAKYRYARMLWDMLQFTMRLPNPRVFVSTTPRPIDVLREIMAAPTTVISRGSTLENRSNLSPEFLKTVVDRYQGTRLGRQELDAEILTDVPGALWTRDMITHLPRSVLPKMRRIVVAIDPPATSEEKSNEAGIVAAGLGEDDRAYVLADRSGVMTPKEWGTAAVMLYKELEADRIVAEVNQGGEMVEHVVRSVDNHVPFVHVRAARGKYTRAEPISALYARGLIDHVGMFEALEDQMCSYTPDFDRKQGSPDRMDALVWALSDLFPSLVADKPKPVGPKLNGPMSAGSLSWMSR